MEYDLVIGLGEIGRPLFEMLSETRVVYGLDLDGGDINA